VLAVGMQARSRKKAKRWHGAGAECRVLSGIE
jgi:hypothetical protein